jgi:hypothetical protein
VKDRNMTKRLVESTLTIIGVAFLFNIFFVSRITFLSAQASSSPILNPEDGHNYEAIAVTDKISWFNSKIEAELQRWNDLRGHLATITSQSEQVILTTVDW